MDKSWFIRLEGTEQGPLSTQEVRDLASAGRVTGQTPIRSEHTQDYTPARFVTGLLPAEAVQMLDLDTPSAVRARAAVPPPSEVFQNYDTPTRHRTKVHAPGPWSAAGGAISVGHVVTPRPRPTLLAQPQWRNLWPLASLMLLMGWIIGGYFTFGRIYLPGSQFPVVVLGAGSLPLALLGIIYYLRPRRLPVGSAIATCLFTGTCGIILLLILQWAASFSLHGVRIYHGRGSIITLVLMAIGTAYDWTTSDNIVQRWFGYVLGVGLCEETTKLLPLVMLILWRSDRRMSVHTFLVLGFVSGLGFGIGEAFYGYAPWKGNVTLAANVIRWYSAVPSHALYTTVCSAFLWTLADRLEQADGFWGRAGVVAMAAGAMAVVHGTYDTICSLGIFAALIMEILSFVLLIWAVHWVSREATEPPEEAATPWVPRVLEPRSAGIAVAGAAALLLIAISLSISRDRGLLALLKTQLPPQLLQYLNGVDITTSAAGEPLSPIAARFNLSSEHTSVVGTFTNTGDVALRDVVIVCIRPLEGELRAFRPFPIGNLEAHAAISVDFSDQWPFAPHDQMDISADGLATKHLTLP